MHSNLWIIEDWAGNVMFLGKLFDSFEDAEEFLSGQIHYDDDPNLDERGEYEIVPVEIRKDE